MLLLGYAFAAKKTQVVIRTHPSGGSYAWFENGFGGSTYPGFVFSFDTATLQMKLAAVGLRSSCRH